MHHAYLSTSRLTDAHSPCVAACNVHPFRLYSDSARKRRVVNHVVNQAEGAVREWSALEEFYVTGARFTSAAQFACSQAVRTGDIVVDATCGNGNDALFLADAVGPSGTLYAIDIQQAAVDATERFLVSSIPEGKRPKMVLLKDCHSKLQELVGSNLAKAICFNMGYLPKGDNKAVTTTVEKSVAAVEAAFEVIQPGGIITMLCYTGHEGGIEEYQALRKLIGELSPNYWTASEISHLNRPTAPILLVLWRSLDNRRKR